MKLSKKLYRVTIMSIEEGIEFNNFDSKNVIAEDALRASKKVRLVKNSRRQTLIQSIEKINHIDKL